jgi:D-glycero-D-manno-heptose 1,7-bisphosphate phosphatase
MPEDFTRYLIDEQRWLRILRDAAQEPGPALFLDRDGVLIEEMDYLSDPGRVRLIPGCCEALRTAKALGLRTVVITNQSGIGRGYFGWAEYFRVECKLIGLLEREGAVPDAILSNSAAAEHAWRKPKPGMLLAAAEALNIDLGKSLIVGDKASDLEAGRNAGLPNGVHVLTGHGKSEMEAARELGTARFRVECLGNIQEFAARLDAFL